MDAIYLDFSKAFDKVPRQRLLVKLRAHGISGHVVNWIENWLSYRKQRVVINGEASMWSDVTSAVPQGSVLGPLLFIIFVNDIDDNIRSNMEKFADDCKLYLNVKTQANIDILQSDLTKSFSRGRKIGRWSLMNQNVVLFTLDITINMQNTQ